MAEKDILIRYKVDDSDLVRAEAIMGRTAQTTDKAQKEAEELNKTLKSTGNEASKSFAKADTSSRAFGNNVSNSKKSVLDLKSAVNSFGNSLGVSFDTSRVDSFREGVKSIGPAVQGGTKAFQLLRLAVIAVPIFALIAGIAALISWFKKTDEGATALEGIFRAFNVTIDIITRNVLKFGEYIFKAFSDPKQALIDLGNLLKDQIINRLTSVVTLAEAVGKAFKGDFEGALKGVADGLGQLTFGVTNITDKVAAMSAEIAQAAKEAYELAFAWDALADRERALSIASAEAEKSISRLLIQAKNRTKSEEDRLGFLEQAAAIEKANFAEQLAVANERLRLVRIENKELEKNGRLGDEAADREADALIKVINLEKQSIDLQEKIANRRDAIIEELIQNRVKKIQEAATLEENAEKDRFARSLINETQLRDKILAIQSRTLEAQKSLLQEYGKDTVEIEKAISEARVQARENDLADQIKLIDLERKHLEIAANQGYLLGVSTKEEVEEEKVEIVEDSLIKQINLLKRFNVDATDLEAQYYQFKADQRAKDNKEAEEQLKREKERLEELKKARIEAQVQAAENAVETAGLINSINANVAAYNNQLDQQRIERLERNKAQEIAIAGSNKEKQAEIEQRYDQKIRELRRKQAERDKKIAIFTAIVNTAQAVVQALASGKYPLNLVFAALTAAAGAVQIATISNQQIPAYNKGTRSVPGAGERDTVPAMLTPGERVITKSTNRKYSPILDAIHDNKIDPQLLNGIATGKIAAGGRRASVEEIVNIQVGEKIKEGIAEALSRIPVNNFYLDEEGYRHSIEKGRSRINYVNKRYSRNV